MKSELQKAKDKAYGQKLRERMVKKNISLTKLAELTGINFTNLSKIRHGKYLYSGINLKKTIDKAIRDYKEK